MVSFDEPFPPPKTFSKFPDLLRTNSPPSPLDASLIRSEIAVARTTLAAVQDYLSKAEPYMEALRNQSNTLTEYIARYENVVSPIRKVPAEVLSHIFILARYDYAGSMWDTCRWPWNLTMVCSKWRTPRPR
ncbi:hypothetical protein HGRIS_005025 [Hohenbuehelia grisea]|uniref:F-box domain-containing protein n=1 Tax=Hohenbuehelia grisea TaxID=104357 RepID=A0ABR3JDS0_9AGAR